MRYKYKKYSLLFDLSDFILYYYKRKQPAFLSTMLSGTVSGICEYCENI